MTAFDQIVSISRSAPDNVFIRTGKVTITYSRFIKLIRGYARFIRGQNPSEFVPLFAGNTVETLLFIIALQMMGKVPALFNLRWSARQVREALRLINRPKIYLSRAQLPEEVKNEFIFTDIPEVSEIREIDELTENVPHELAAVLFTSGSSGTPKGVKLSHDNFFTGAHASNLNIPLAPKDCWGISLPLYHTGGFSIIYRSILAGASVYLFSQLTTDEIFKAIEKGVTHLSLVPVMLQRLIDEDSKCTKLRDLKAILLGGAPPNEKLIRTINRMGLPVYTTYGLTEAASQVATFPHNAPPEKRFTAGKPLSSVRLQIRDTAGNVLPENRIGEIYISGNTLFRGYLGQPDREPGDWFPTGDLGYLDEEGYLTVTGRRDNLIISGGENISPEEIETVAAEFPRVKGAAAVGIEHEEWGERPVLVVETEETKAFPLDEFREFLQNRLSGIQMPENIFIVRELPRISILKINRTEVKRLVNALLKKDPKDAGYSQGI